VLFIQTNATVGAGRVVAPTNPFAGGNSVFIGRLVEIVVDGFVGGAVVANQIQNLTQADITLVARGYTGVTKQLNISHWCPNTDFQAGTCNQILRFRDVRKKITVFFRNNIIAPNLVNPPLNPATCAPNHLDHACKLYLNGRMYFFAFRAPLGETMR